MINGKIPTLLHLLLILLNVERVSHHRSSKETPRQQEGVGFLNPKTLDDVQEFQKVLHTASLDEAKRLLELFDSIRRIRNESDDPEKIENRRIHLETIEKGQCHQGIGWVWKGNICSRAHRNHRFL